MFNTKFCLVGSALVLAALSSADLAQAKMQGFSIRRQAEDGQTYWKASSSDGKTVTGSAGCNSSYTGCTRNLNGTVISNTGGQVIINWDNFGTRTITLHN